jgi:hypothetical protein
MENKELFRLHCRFVHLVSSNRILRRNVGAIVVIRNRFLRVMHKLIPRWKRCKSSEVNILVLSLILIPAPRNLSPWSGLLFLKTVGAQLFRHSDFFVEREG